MWCSKHLVVGYRYTFHNASTWSSMGGYGRDVFMRQHSIDSVTLVLGMGCLLIAVQILMEKYMNLCKSMKHL